MFLKVNVIAKKNLVKLESFIFLFIYQTTSFYHVFIYKHV